MAFLLARARHNLLTRSFLRLVLGVVFIYIYCEYLIYYVTQIQVSKIIQFLLFLSFLFFCPSFHPDVNYSEGVSIFYSVP